MRIVAAALVVSMSSGCSFLFVQPPKDDFPSSANANCTTSQVAPVVDSIFTLTNLLSAFYVAHQDNITNKGTAVGAGLFVGAIWVSSAIYGYYHTSRCSELLSEEEAEPIRTGYRPPRRPMVSIPAEATQRANPGQPAVRLQKDDVEEARARQQPDAGLPDPMPGFED